MGIDFLDMTFRIEKRFGIRFGRHDWVPFFDSAPPRELTAGGVADFVEQFIRGAGAVPPDRWRIAKSKDEGSRILDYRGLPPPDLGLDVWVEIQKVLSEMLCIPVGKIHRHSLLIKDLGMT